MLLEAFLAVTAQWREVFPQARSWRRAMRQALGSLVCLGRRCLSRIIWTNGGEQRSWSAEYFLHSRCRWNEQELFTPIIAGALLHCRRGAIGVAVDDTRLRKTGRCITQAFYQRDPMSPPFHVNLMLGLRFLQASALVGRHGGRPIATRGLPIRFEEVSPVKRPSRRAPREEWRQYREAAKQHNLSQAFVQMARALRQAFDAAGAAARLLILAGDGSFCNRTCLRAVLERLHLIARTRRDAVLCRQASDGTRRFYDPRPFTPDDVRRDEQTAWQRTKVWYGGKRRVVRLKDVSPVFWRRGGGRRPLRVLVVAPTPYRKRKSGKRYYRHPAFLLTTDLHSSASVLLQIYFDRWQIEVNHREEKDTLGIGQAQLWNSTAVPKQPVLCVAAYSALLLAALQAFGPDRGAAYAPLPKWRRHAHRPSCLDLVCLLRKDMVQHPELLAPFRYTISDEQLTAAAAA